MNDQLSPFVQAFNQSVREAEVFLCITRDSELQRAALAALQSKVEEVSIEKSAAIEAQDEDYANLLLGCQCVALALSAEIKMWLLLKGGNPDAAWDELITAQMASIDAVRAHEGFHHLEQNNLKLEAIESLIFPPQVFISSGLVVSTQECSICGNEYEDCDHLVGKPYMGKFCHINARGLKADHVALVKDPADKRCRVTQFGVEGGNRNRMTWKVHPRSDDV
jgi:hypothetical protein